MKGDIKKEKLFIKEYVLPEKKGEYNWIRRIYIVETEEEVIT